MVGVGVRWFGVVMVAIACEASSDAAGTADSDASESSAGSAGSPARGSGGTAAGGGSGGTAAGGGGRTDTGVASDATSEATGDTSNDDAARIDGATCIAPGAPTTIPTAYCEVVAALPCGTGLDVPGCVELIDEGVAQAETRGCKCELLAELACAVDLGLICPVDFDDVRLNPACASIEDASQRCMGQGDNCSHGIVVGGQSCTVACDQYAADCSRSGTGAAWTCTCSYGPKLGKTFTPADCDEPNVAAACR